MRTVSRSALVSYRPEEMFSLVDAVEDYPNFLPWCGGTELIYRDHDRTRATILVSYRGIRQSFTTENLKRVPEEMRIRLVEGPFRKLEGSWRFNDLGGRGCKVDLNLQFEFASRALSALAGPVFQHIASTMLEAFVKRADAIYGGNGSARET